MHFRVVFDKLLPHFHPALASEFDKDQLLQWKKMGKRLFESYATPGVSRQAKRWMDQIGGDDDAKVNSNSMEVSAMIQNIKNNTPGMGENAPPDYDIFGKKKYAYRFIRKKQPADISPELHTELVRIMPDIKEIRKYLILDPLKMESLKAKYSKNKSLQKINGNSYNIDGPP